MRHNRHYEERVNRVLDYIGTHLDGELSLGRLAEVGGFSAFHFHRVFQGVTGETLNVHVRRVRLERAAQLLRSSLRKRITDVALEVGFGGTAEFSRAFRNHFGCTASSWDRKAPLKNSKICKAPEMLTFETEEELERWKDTEASEAIRVQSSGAIRFVYNRIFAPYGGTKIVDNYYALRKWLAGRGVEDGDVVFIGMSLDDPSITPSEHCRYDLGVAFAREPAGLISAILRARGRGGAAVPEPGECEGFSVRDFEPQPMVAFHCVGDIRQVGKAWQYLYRMWLPSSNYEPGDAPAMEMFVQLPEEIGWEKFNLQLCIPVARL